jgi:hypothetical protein
MIDRSLTMRVVQLNFDQRVFDGTTLFDGELVLNEDTHRWNYLIFDLIGSGSDMRPSDNFFQRLKNSIHIVNTMFQPVEERDPFLVSVKRFVPTQEIQTLASAVEMHQGRRSDGLIFVPVHRQVKPYRNRIMYKWKEQTHHTIDCLLRYAAKTESASTRTPATVVAQSIASADSLIKNACQRRVISLPAKVLQRSVVILKMMNATLKNPLRRLTCALEKNSKKAKEAPVLSVSEFGKSISPNSIDLTAFELFLIDTKNQLIFFDRCDAELNRDFLHRHAMQIVAAGHEIVVECCFAGKSSETQRPLWKIMLERKDRLRPNTEFTVQRTIENIEENITLVEIIDCFRKNNDGTWLNIQPVLPQSVNVRENRKNTNSYPNRPPYYTEKFTQPHKAPQFQQNCGHDFRKKENSSIRSERTGYQGNITKIDQPVSAKRATWAQTMESVSLPALSAEKRQRRENFDHRPQWLIDQMQQKNSIEQYSSPDATLKEAVEEYNPMMPAYDYGDSDEESLNPPPAVVESNLEKPNVAVPPLFETVDQTRLLSMLEELQQSLSKIPCESLSLKHESLL